MQAHGKVRGLLKALKHRNVSVQMDAVHILGELKDPKDISLLVQALFRGEGERVRWGVQDALKEIGTPAFEPLISALRQNGGRPTNESRQFRGIIGRTLANIGTAVVEPLIAALRDKTYCSYVYEESDNEIREYFIRETAVDALAEIDSAIDPLKNALGDIDESVRYAAVDALWKSHSQRRVKALVAALADEYEPVRNLAERALLEMPMIATNLYSNDLALHNVEVEYDREYLRYDDVGDIYSYRAKNLDTAINNLKKHDTQTRLVAAYALGISGDDRAVQSLMDALNDEDGSVVRMAAISLAKILPNYYSQLRCTKEKTV